MQRKAVQNAEERAATGLPICEREYSMFSLPVQDYPADMEVPVLKMYQGIVKGSQGYFNTPNVSIF